MVGCRVQSKGFLNPEFIHGILSQIMFYCGMNQVGLQLENFKRTARHVK